MLRAVSIVSMVALLLATLMLFPAVRADINGSVPDATAFTTQRKLVRFSHGGLALAYVVQVDGTNRVQVARSSEGMTWFPLDPPSLTGPTADRPALAVDSHDVLHLAWTANDASGRQVFYASYANGAWSSAEQVSDTTGYSGFPSIAVDSRDRVHVAWYGFDGTYYQVYYRMRDASGWASQVAVTAESVDATNPALAVDGRDVLHIVWYHINSHGTGFQVSYARLAGGLTTTETISGAEDAVDPTMVIDREGRAIVAWTAPGAIANIAVTTMEGDVWSDPARVTPSDLGASHPSLTLDGAGNEYLFFQGHDDQIYVQQRLNGTWAAAAPMTSGGNNSYPSARWSYYPVRSPSGPPMVDVVWTAKTDAGTTVRFASTIGSAAPEVPTENLGSSDAWFLGGIVAVVVGFVILVRWRRGRS